MNFTFSGDEIPVAKELPMPPDIQAIANASKSSFNLTEFSNSLSNLFNSITPLTQTIISTAAEKNQQQRLLQAQTIPQYLPIPGTNRSINTETVLLIGGITIVGILIAKKMKGRKK